MQQLIGNEITYLLPGELIVTDQRMKISTVLGSCVSVCMFYRTTQIAGMNHFILPLNTAADPKILRYGDTSLEEMLSQMCQLGAKANRIEAFVYGGSAMFAKNSDTFKVGERNIQSALQFLKFNHIFIQSIETGGTSGRKVIFDTSAGIISSNVLKPLGKLS